jgi:hypothetical protein
MSTGVMVSEARPMLRASGVWGHRVAWGHRWDGDFLTLGHTQGSRIAHNRRWDTHRARRDPGGSDLASLVS